MALVGGAATARLVAPGHVAARGARLVRVGLVAGAALLMGAALLEVAVTLKAVLGRLEPELYRRYLEPLGEWTVVPADDPRQAYELARATQPAVVLLDLLMPGTDGWTILNLLHASDDTKDIPVIVCSVFHDALLAEALGAKAHLRKPVSQSELLSAVSRWAR